jgi:hypothetical protein
MKKSVKVRGRRLTKSWERAIKKLMQVDFERLPKSRKQEIYGGRLYG